tara:strand:+ start:25547 stop:26602 length:1056 start_codon:yes stop_codon:yes gene_type:complete
LILTAILRGIAILLAVGWHVNHVDTGMAWLNLLLWPGARFGWAGVDLFFVLSGFLVGRLIFREIDRTGTLDLRRFFLRRVLRLWPVLYLFLIAMAFSGAAPLREFFWQIALHIQNYADVSVATHSWSLAVEEHFYLIFALGLTVLFAFKKQVTLLPGIFVGIIVLSPVLRGLGFWLGADFVQLQQQTHYRLDGISAGALLAYLTVFKPDVFKRVHQQKVLQVLGLIAGVIFVSMVSKNTPAGAIIGYSMAALGGTSALLLLHQSGIERHLPRLCFALSFVGLISYPLYLWHVPVVRILEIGLHGKIPVWALVVLQYSLSILFSYVVTRVLERPMMALRDKIMPTGHASVSA